MYFFFQHGDISLGEPSGRDFRENVVEYGAIPYEITHPGEQCAQPDAGPEACGQSDGGLAPTWLTLLTSMFMHGGLLHLGGNMLFLWIFGNNIEDSMGRLKFVGFYLAGGLVADFGQTIVDTDSTIPTIGASGAVSEVSAVYAQLDHRARVLTRVVIIDFITVIELLALLVLGLWSLSQLSGARQPVAGDGGGVAYFAHIGGFLFGMPLIKLL